MKPLDISEQAAWKKRYRAASVLWSKLAAQNPERGLVCTNQHGIFQLYAWEVASGELRQLTDQPAGVVNGGIAADGSAVFYHKDAQGNEVGQFMRVPFEGGAEIEVTPELPPYPAWSLAVSKGGGAYSFITARSEDGFNLYLVMDTREARLIFEQKEALYGPYLSYDAALVAVESAKRSGTIDTSVVVLETASGKLVGELWDGEETSTSVQAFAPAAGDERPVRGLLLL